MPDERRVGFEDLLVQMRMTNAILAAMLQRQEEMPQKDLIMLLADTGSPALEIAGILGITVNNVRVTLSKSRNRGIKEKE